MRQLLFAGIDPGTTAGWAVIDKTGKLIAAGSKKGISIDELISTLKDLGKIIALGTDKAKIPSTIRTISAKFEAKIVTPRQDIGKTEKRELTKDEFYTNDHEADAIAAAKNAYKRYLPLIKKIRSYTEKNDEKEIEDKIIEKVIKTECAIKLAAEEIKKEMQTLQKEQQKIEIETEIDAIKTLPSIETMLRNENKALKKHINKQNNQIKEISAKLLRSDKAEKISPEEIKKKQKEKRDRTIQEKEILIRNLRKELLKIKEELKQKNTDQKILIRNIKNLSGKSIIKKIKNLGMNEFEKIEKFIQKGEILYVEEPSNFSQKVIKKLKEKEIEIIIHDKAITQKIKNFMPFLFIPKKEVNIETVGEIGFLDKNSIEKNKKLIMQKIIQNYLEERNL